MFLVPFCLTPSSNCYTICCNCYLVTYVYLFTVFSNLIKCNFGLPHRPYARSPRIEQTGRGFAAWICFSQPLETAALVLLLRNSTSCPNSKEELLSWAIVPTTNRQNQDLDRLPSPWSFARQPSNLEAAAEDIAYELWNPPSFNNHSTFTLSLPKIPSHSTMTYKMHSRGHSSWGQVTTQSYLAVNNGCIFQNARQIL